MALNAKILFLSNAVNYPQKKKSNAVNYEFLNLILIISYLKVLESMDSKKPSLGIL